jgi:hypothetical protein
MRRVAVCCTAVVLALSACGSSGSDGAGSGSGSGSGGSGSGGSGSPAVTSTTPTSATGPIPQQACAPFATVTELWGELEQIAVGAHAEQVQADEEFDTAVLALLQVAKGRSTKLDDALGVLDQVSFQVTEAPSTATADEVDAAIATLTTALAGICPATPADTSGKGQGGSGSSGKGSSGGGGSSGSGSSGSSGKGSGKGAGGGYLSGAGSASHRAGG